MSLLCMPVATLHRWGKGSMLFVLRVAVRISAAIREQCATVSLGLDEARNAAQGRPSTDEKYGIDEQAVTDAPVETPCTSSESALSEYGQGGDRWQTP